MTQPESINDALRLAFDLSPVGLCVTSNREIVLCNTAFGAMFGYEPGQLQGQPLAPLYPSMDEFVQIGELGMASMRTTGSFGDERIMKRRDGSLFWCHVVGRASDRVEPFARAVWMFEDISDRRHVAKGLTTREREIARLLVTGATAKEIGRTLGMSPRTVEAHRARLMGKLGVKNYAELVAQLVGS